MPVTVAGDLLTRLGGRYTIERELGRGGMGAVYLARDLRLDRQVALKVLPPELAGDTALRERFLRETRTAASFSHPNIVPVHEVLEGDGVLAFAMGFVEGESLMERVRREGPLEVRGIVRVLQDVGYALAYAHGRGVVHRDIKPDNIMLERATGRALLMDFGISRAITATVAAPGLTRVGEVVGTPEYMSPEQASGDQVDGRSDIYSLGLVALFALTGGPVITADSTQKILVKQLTELPPPATSLRPDLPPTLGAAIDRCVAKVPSERFTTAEALVESIDAAQLAAPEIPLPVRLFAQELGTLSLVISFLIIFSPFLTRNSGVNGSLDGLIPLTVITAVVLARVAATLGSARQLARLGFSAADILKGMEGVVAERESVRARNRADPELRRQRGKTMRLATILLAIAAALIFGVYLRRVKQGPHVYAIGLWGVVMGAAAIILIAFSFIMFTRNPFRMPLGERMFRAVWLGPVGRAFLRLGSRGAPSLAHAPSTATMTPAAVGTPSRALTARRAGRTLEDRVAALEQWRESEGHHPTPEQSMTVPWQPYREPLGATWEASRWGSESYSRCTRPV